MVDKAICGGKMDGNYVQKVFTEQDYNIPATLRDQDQVQKD